MQIIDLQEQLRTIRSAIDARITKVLDHGKFIMGPEIAELEAALQQYTSAKYAITCSSGTDALLLPLLAWGIGPGDVVFVPAFMFVAAAEVVALTGATPFLVDVAADSYNINPDSLEQAIKDVGKTVLRAKGIIAVDLFGQPADYAELKKLARLNNLWLIADAAQSFGATLNQTRVGTLADVTTTSFFPAKPLGCYGDGGAIFTEDANLAEILFSLRGHGAGSHRYQHVRIGTNARLDTLQAAVLLEKLKIFDQEFLLRQKVAATYEQLLNNFVTTPSIAKNKTSSWAQYTIASEFRDKIKLTLEQKGIGCAVHYPYTVAEHVAYRNFPSVSSGLAVSQYLTKHVLSLPMHPYLTIADQQQVATAVQAAVQQAVLS